MGYLKKYWKKYKWLFILSVTCVACEAVCDLLQPKFMSNLVDNGAVKGDLNYVLRTALIMLAITGAGAVFAITRNISASVASQSFGAELRNDMFAKIQSLSVDNMDRFEGGSLITRMTNDVIQLQNFVNGMMRIFFKAPIMCAGAIVMAATLNWRTIPVIVPVIILVAFVIAVSMRLTYPRFAKVQQALDRLNTTMREYLAGIRLVKAFRRFKEEEQRFSDANNTLADNTVKANKILAVFSPLMSLVVNLSIALIIFTGAHWVDMKDMEVGQIMAFITYMTQILNSLGMISNVLNTFVRVKTSNERIRMVFDADADDNANYANYDSVGKRRAVSANVEMADGDNVAHIVFDNVGFEYKGSTGQAALSGLNFEVERGETLGVIGPTGSGKSTLAALLMHFYAATKGKILISGVSIDEMPESVLRSQSAIVPQTASLFTGTIKENILWGREDASDAQVEEASEAAEAHGFITAMPEGYNTLIGQSGVNLSGGQKQRVSIARALIRRPEILTFDDCTSALDVITEAKVKRAIRHFSENMTCILITQRINTAMTCDKILVLDSGNQAGFGTHNELMETCPVYRDIYMSQIGTQANKPDKSENQKGAAV